MQCKLKQNFVFALPELIKNVLPAVTTLPLIPSVGSLPNTKKLLFGLSIWGD